MEQYKGKATASLVLGIVAVVLGWFGFFAIAGLVCGIIGLVMSIGVRKAAQAEGFELSGSAKAGFVLSIIGVILCGVLFIACVACAGAIGSAGMAAGLM